MKPATLFRNPFSAATSLSVLAAATSLSALAQEVNDGFRLNTASITYSNSLTRVSDTGTATGFPEGTPNNVGRAKTNGISLGLSASFLARLSGGINVTGTQNKGFLEQRIYDLEHKNDSFGYSGHINYKIFGPISIGISAGKTSLSGTLSNTPVEDETDRAGFSSKSRNLGGYIACPLPVDDYSSVSISIAYNTSKNVTRYDVLPPVVLAATEVKTARNMLIFNLGYNRVIIDKWRANAGVSVHRVTHQETPDGDTRRSRHMLRPSVGLTYELNDRYTLAVGHSLTNGDPKWNTRATTFGLSYIF